MAVAGCDKRKRPNPAGRKLPALPGSLPARMHVLFVTGANRTGGWLAEAFASDSASEVCIEEAIGIAAGLARLREAVFDTVLIGHHPGELDALELLDALRAGSSDEQPIIVLGSQSEQEMLDQCFEVGADAYVCVNTTTTRSLIWQVARATDRHRLIRENRRLVQSGRQRLQREHEEAERLLLQQRALIGELESLRETGPATEAIVPSEPLPERLVTHYRELLRAYVIMGSGNLSDEMTRLADLLATAGVTAQQTMLMHLQVLEEMVQGLGSRSARHVLNRADLLVLEVMIRLAEGYHKRLRSITHPPQQRLLPGFEPKNGPPGA